MRKHFLSLLFLLLSVITSAQTRVQLFKDSVRITNGELIIRNSSKEVQGYLYNTGNGLTQFRAIDTIPNPVYQVTLSKNELDAAIVNSSLKAGMSYRITGACPALYGGTDIIVSAVTSNRITINGSGLFYNPNYPAYEFYDTDSTYATGDTATWGGYVWVNVSGSLGSSSDAFTLSSADWVKLPYDTIRYVRSWDEIKYNYSKDFIFCRRDDLNNEVTCDSTSLEYKWYYPQYFYSPIKAFKWGSPKIYNNTVKESYAEFINIDTASRVNGNAITTRSYFRNNKIINSYLAGNIFERYVKVENNIFKNADISYNTLIGGTMLSNTVIGQYAYDFVQGAALFKNNIHKGAINSNMVVPGAGSTAWISGNTGLGNITNCHMTAGQISNNTLANGNIAYDTLTAGGEIINNFISGNADSSTSISDCNLSTIDSIADNHVLLTGKISKSTYSVSNCSIKSYILVPTGTTSSKTFIGTGTLNLTLTGFAANRLLASDGNGNAAWSSLILGGNSPTSSITYQTTSATGSTGADHIFRVGSNGATVAMRILNNGNVGIGTSPSAKLHLLRTTEQLRIGYDASNYLSMTVGSTANTTINPTGTSTGLTINGSAVAIAQAAANRMTFNDSTSGTGIVNVTGGSGTTVSGVGFNIGSGSYSSTSGVQYPVALLPTINQSSTAGYTALLISPKENSVGSGLINLLDMGKSTGATPATHTSLFRINNAGKITITATNTASGSTGAKTINKPAGSVNFATSAQTLVVTNSTVTASSMILLTIEANSTSTATSAYVLAKSAGSFTIKLNAAANIETRVNFLVLN